MMEHVGPGTNIWFKLWNIDLLSLILDEILFLTLPSLAFSSLIPIFSSWHPQTGPHLIFPIWHFLWHSIGPSTWWDPHNEHGASPNVYHNNSTMKKGCFFPCIWRRIRKGACAKLWMLHAHVTSRQWKNAKIKQIKSRLTVGPTKLGNSIDEAIMQIRCPSQPWLRISRERHHTSITLIAPTTPFHLLPKHLSLSLSLSVSLTLTPSTPPQYLPMNFQVSISPPSIF